MSIKFLVLGGGVYFGFGGGGECRFYYYGRENFSEKMQDFVFFTDFELLSETPEGAGKMVPRENCRKVSKNFLTLFDDVWRFLPCARSAEKCWKTFWHFLTIFDVFLTWPLSAGPFCNPLILAWEPRNLLSDLLLSYLKFFQQVSWPSGSQVKYRSNWATTSSDHTKAQSNLTIPGGWYRAQKGGGTEPKSPWILKTRKKLRKKNTKSPTPGCPPKIRKKYRKNAKMVISGPFVYFFRIFGGQPGVGDFVCVFFCRNFSYFRDSGVFGLCTTPTGS